MRKLIALLLSMALLVLPFAALAEDYEAENYEVLKQVLDELELDYDAWDSYSMTSLILPMEEDYCEELCVEGFAWDVAVEFDAYYDFEVPEDRIVEISVLLTWINRDTWMSSAYLNRETGEVGFNAKVYSGDMQPANAYAVLDVLYGVVGDAADYGEAIYRVAIGGESAEAVIAELAE